MDTTKNENEIITTPHVEALHTGLKRLYAVTDSVTTLRTQVAATQPEVALSEQATALLREAQQALFAAQRVAEKDLAQATLRLVVPHADEPG